jgi:fatty acid CoA ligase FadD9
MHRLFGWARRSFESPRVLSDKLKWTWHLNQNSKLWGIRKALYNYEWHSYDEIFRKAQTLAVTLAKAGIEPRQVIAICCSSGSQWIIADLACAMGGFVSLPIDHLASTHTIQSLCIYSNSKLILCNEPIVPKIQPIVGMKSIFIIESIQNTPKFDPNAILHLSEEQDREFLFTLQPTSGSTGEPKLLQRTRWNWLDREGGKDTTILLGSLASPAPRSWLWLSLFSGGCMAESNIETLIEDCQIVQPTQVSAPPIVWENICQRILSGQIRPVADLEGHINWTTSLFGSNCKAVTNTGALLSASTRDAMKQIFGGTAHDGYGSSETGGIAIDGNLLPGVEIQLLDVPELGYTSLDRPYPRGELLVKTSTMFDGYYSGGEILESGWLATGDIVQLIAPRSIEVIDRKSYCVKLTNGKYVSLTSIEHQLQASELAQQVCVLLDSSNSKLLAVIVPVFSNLRKYLSRTGKNQWNYMTDEQLCHSDDVCNEIVLHLRALQQQSEKAAPHEYIRGVILEWQPFSRENNLLTPSLKLCRPALVQKYTPKIALVSDSPVSCNTKENSIESIILHAAHEIVGRVVSLDDQWSSLGLDSLAAIQLSQTLSKHFGFAVSVSSIFRSNSVRQLVSELEVSFDTGKQEQSQFSTQANDWKAENDVIASDLRVQLRTRFSKANHSKPSLEKPSHVLLTGASGFLGIHLLEQLLVINKNILVSCLLRPESATQFAKKQKYYGIELSQKDFDRVKILSGDISLPQFGMNREKYEMLYQDCDTIVHCAANVNWKLPYSALRFSNSLPIIDLIDFAGQRKIHFISSIAVAEPGSCETCSPQPNVEYGYGASKWVAEKLLNRAARELGTNIVIYRPGHLVSLVSEHQSSLGLNMNDFLALLIRGFVHAKGYPVFHKELTTEWSCVRTTAQAISQSVLAHCVDSRLPTEFNVFTDRSTRYQILVDGLVAEGVALKALPLSEWRSKISQEDSPLYPLQDLLFNGLSGSDFRETHTHSNIQMVAPFKWPAATMDSARAWVRFVLDQNNVK